MPGDRTISDFLADGVESLTRHRIESPRTEAEILLAHVLSKNRAHIYAHPEEIVPPEAAGEYARLLSMRIAGAPLQYIIGVADFHEVSLLVNHHVLIPRPETEVLVATLLSAVRKVEFGRDRRTVRILDLGTGSGAIAIAVAHALLREMALEVVATDVSLPALEVARENVKRYGLEGVIDLRQGDMFRALREEELFDVIASNPPYVSVGDLAILPADVREREPRIALVSGETGFEHIETLVREAHRHLVDGGLLIFEIGLGQEDIVGEMLEQSGNYERVSFEKDLVGITRVALAYCASTGGRGEGGNPWRNS